MIRLDLPPFTCEEFSAKHCGKECRDGRLWPPLQKGWPQRATPTPERRNDRHFRQISQLALKWALLIVLCNQEVPAARPQAKPEVSVEVVKVVAQKLEKSISLPGDLMPYQSVAIYPRVTGFVDSVEVDRGSWVKQGQVLVVISAPELEAQHAEAEAKAQSIEAQRVEAMAKLVAAESTYQRLKTAGETPGVVAGNDLEIAQKTVEAERARVDSLEHSKKAAQAAVLALQQIRSYLRVTAPFDGVITERNVHLGSLVGPSGAAANLSLLRIEEVLKLRLVVAVPEAYVAGISPGTRVSFTVPAFPGESFHGTVQRPAHSLDIKTRTMPVELDVSNRSQRLAPGMYADVAWPVRRMRPTLFVPPSAIVTTTERSFVIRLRDGVAEWVDVKRGVTVGNLIEVFGNLRDGDFIARRATDELRAGTRVATRLAATP